jgi:hypothetical protein
MHKISLYLQEIDMNLLYVENVTSWKVNKIQRAPSASLEWLFIQA